MKRLAWGFWLLPFVVPALAGGIRASTYMSLWPAMALSGASLVALLLLTRVDSKGTLVVPAVCFGLFSCGVLFDARFDGMPSVGGGDAGNHLSIHFQFLKDAPNIYHGFVAGYALVGAFERVGLDPFESFRAVYYLVFFGVATAPVLTLSTHSKKQTALALVSVASLWLFFLGPELHYLQSDGFFAHAFSLGVLLALVVFIRALSPNTVLPWCLLTLVAVRFSYGLNLGDMALSMAVATAFLPVSRRLKAPLVVALSLIGLVAWWNLWPIFNTFGSLVEPRWKYRLLGTFLSCVGLLVLRQKIADDKRFVSNWAAAFAVFSLVADGVLWSTQKPQYYFFKHMLGPAMVSLVVLISELFSNWRATASLVRTRWLLVGLVGLSFASQVRASVPYFESFAERLTRPHATAHLTPLFSPSVAAAVAKAADEQHCRVGGIVTPVWHQWVFLNAAFQTFDVWKTGEKYFPDKMPHQPGRCRFWVESVAPPEAQCVQVDEPHSIAGKQVCFVFEK